MRQLARNANFQHLQELDLLWTGAILADRAQKDRQSCPLRDRDFLLDSTIDMGLYDNEAANTFLEKSMRYHWGQRVMYRAVTCLVHCEFWDNELSMYLASIL